MKAPASHSYTHPSQHTQPSPAQGQSFYSTPAAAEPESRLRYRGPWSSYNTASVNVRTGTKPRNLEQILGCFHEPPRTGLVFVGIRDSRLLLLLLLLSTRLPSLPSRPGCHSQTRKEPSEVIPPASRVESRQNPNCFHLTHPQNYVTHSEKLMAVHAGMNTRSYIFPASSFVGENEI